MNWKRSNKLINEPLVDYLEKLIDEKLNQGFGLRVSIGTDSQRISKFEYKFATVILITMSEDLGGGTTVGRGGMIVHNTFLHEFKNRGKELVNERMVFEVSKSIEVAQEIALLLDVYEIPLEIHADINPNPKHESNKALQSAVGYILGMGFDFKIKPDAIASSNCADKLC